MIINLSKVHYLLFFNILLIFCHPAFPQYQIYINGSINSRFYDGDLNITVESSNSLGTSKFLLEITKIVQKHQEIYKKYIIEVNPVVKRFEKKVDIKPGNYVVRACKIVNGIIACNDTLGIKEISIIPLNGIYFCEDMNNNIEQNINNFFYCNEAKEKEIFILFSNNNIDPLSNGFLEITAHKYLNQDSLISITSIKNIKKGVNILGKAKLSCEGVEYYNVYLKRNQYDEASITSERVSLQ